MYVVSNMHLTYKADVWRTSPLKRVGQGVDFFYHVLIYSLPAK